MQVAYRSEVFRSTANQFNPLDTWCSLPERSSFPRFPGHQRSHTFILRSPGSTVCKSVVRIVPSSHVAEKINTVEGGTRIFDESSVRSWKVRTILASLGSGRSISLSKAAARAEELDVDTSAEATEGAALNLFTAAFISLIGATGPAFAEVAPVEMVDDSQYWWDVLLTSGAAGILYLVVFPLIIYNYLRLRWYKRSALETYFQFMLVFIFFPGLLLFAPFINFRRLPKEGTEAP